ncbi:MAG: hypothetical protein Q9O62_14050 [Ardenticatenia bacterium]|nr:hypothetical protein [Ardenticatenia bacterium]
MPMVAGGEELGYSIVVTNTGSLPIHNVYITDTVPAYTTYIAGSLACYGCTQVQMIGNTIYGYVDTLGPGSIVEIFFDVTVDSDAIVYTDSIVNTATASASGLPPKSATVTDLLDGGGGGPQLLLSDTTAAPGSTITLAGVNYPPETPVSVDVNGSPLTTVRTNRTGQFFVNLQIEETVQQGYYTVQASTNTVSSDSTRRRQQSQAHEAQEDEINVTAAILLRVDDSAPRRTPPREEPTVVMPSNIRAYTYALFVPFVVIR